MMHRRSLRIVTIAASLVAPLAASAQTGTVTVVPGSVAAPAVSALMLGLLAVVLTVVTAVVLRRRSAVLGSGLALVIAAVMVAGIGHAAFTTFTIEGNECNEETTENFFPGGAPRLLSDCSNPIQIVDIDVECNGGEVPPQETLDPCSVGQTLNPGNDCALPTCE